MGLQAISTFPQQVALSLAVKLEHLQKIWNATTSHDWKSTEKFMIFDGIESICSTMT
jgi:hypothetical protein